MALTFDQKVGIQPGLLRSHVFSLSDEFSAHGNDIASFRSTEIAGVRTLDTTRLACGKPSLRFEIRPFLGSDHSGQWGCRFTPGAAPGTQFGEGEEFWYQYMYCCEKYLYEHNFKGNWGNFKISMVGTGDSLGCVPGQSTSICPGTCTDLELVHTSGNSLFQFPTLYNSCVLFDGFRANVINPSAAFDDEQPWRPVQPANQADACSHAVIAAAVPWSQFTENISDILINYPAAYNNCRTWASALANPTDLITRWTTYTFQVQIGSYNAGTNRWVGSHVNAWMHFLGDPNPAIQWMNHTKDLYAAGNLQKYGRLWLLAYMTNKDNRDAPVDPAIPLPENHAVTNAWYANVIIATQPIPKETADAPELALITL